VVFTNQSDIRPLSPAPPLEFQHNFFFAEQMHKHKRQRISTHMLEDDKEELWLSLKTRIGMMADLQDVYQNDA